MTFPFRLALLSLGLALAACTPSDPQTQVSNALTKNVLLPAYAAWEQSSQQLAGSAEAYCAGTQDLEQARTSFLTAQTAWAALQPLQIGPLTEGNRSWQVQFWPDKKNLVARQVENLLKSKPQLQPSDLEQASVVVQGLSAYEYVLFDQAIDLAQAASKERYCPLLISIGQHQKQLAGAVFQEWQDADGISAQLESFPNSRYADAAEANADILRAQVLGLDMLKKKLGVPLGIQSKNIAQPYQAESWRSGASLINLSAGVASAKHIWQGQPEPGLRSLLSADQQKLIEQIDAAYATTQQQLAALQKPMHALLAGDSVRAQLTELYQSLDKLQRLHASELAKALGVQLGFNSHDGD